MHLRSIAAAMIAALFPLSLASCTSDALPLAEPSVAQTTELAPDLPPAPDTSALIPEGWREIVVSVSDLGEMRDFYTSTLGWEVRSEGQVPRDTLTAWKLPEQATARFVLVANPQTASGFVRIIDFDGVPQERIRDHDQAWETGGIFNMNIRAHDIADLAVKVTNAGWQAPSAPVQFVFGPFIVWEWIPRHRDSVRVALMERVAPPLENWPYLKTTSRTFNSTQIVADFDRAVAFYQGVLGFKTYLDHRGASEREGEHVLGLSNQAMASIVRQVRIVSPKGDNEGSIELLAFEGYNGRDFSDRAVPPNLGNLMLRFAVPSVEQLQAHLEAYGIALEYAPTTTQLAPYGEVKLLAIRAPDGAWLEFFEVL